MNDQPEKNFRISEEDVQDLATGIGGCFATDHILVDGQPVGLMYRENPVNEIDSGWRFFGGEETEDQICDPNFLGFYDVNLVANCDPSIIPFLDKPVGYAFQRNEDGEFEGADFGEDVAADVDSNDEMIE